MAQYQIPLSNLPAQEVNTVLGNQNCIISIYMRGEEYYFDLKISNETIYEGLICGVGIDLNPFAYRGFKGKLTFVNVDNDGDKIDYKDFGTKYFLIYEG